MKKLSTTAFYLIIGTLFTSNNLFSDEQEHTIGYHYKYQDLAHKFISTPKPAKFEKLMHKVITDKATSWSTPAKTKIIMDIIYQEKPTVCVDIGAFNGGTTFPMAQALKFLKSGKVYAIDAYSNQVAVKGLSSSDKNYKWWSEVDLKSMKKTLEKRVNTAGLNNHVAILEMTSEDAAKLIENIDFLHIDGGMTENASSLDVDLYLPKVKSGGYVLITAPFIVTNRELARMSAIYKLFEKCDLVHQEMEEFALFKKR